MYYIGDAHIHMCICPSEVHSSKAGRHRSQTKARHDVFILYEHCTCIYIYIVHTHVHTRYTQHNGTHKRINAYVYAVILGRLPLEHKVAQGEIGVWINTCNAVHKVLKVLWGNAKVDRTVLESVHSFVHQQYGGAT